MKIIIIVLSSEEGIYAKFKTAQKETWDKEKIDGVKTYYLHGNSKVNEIIDDDILTNVSESLQNCGYKTLKAFQLIKNFDYDFVFRTNSSSYVDKNLLVEFVKSKPKENHYSGVIGDYHKIKFASGSGFLISKDVINKLLENVNLFNFNVIDDVMIGDALSKLDIYPTPNPRFDITHRNITNIPTEYFHYRLKTDNRLIDIENMYLIKNLKHGKNSDSNE